MIVLTGYIKIQGNSIETVLVSVELIRVGIALTSSSCHPTQRRTIEVD